MTLRMIEIIMTLFLSLIIASNAYVFYLCPQIDKIIEYKNNYQKNLLTLQQKKQKQVTMLATHQALLTWQHQHPRLFQEINVFNNNYFIQQFTALLQKNNIAIVRMDPLHSHKKTNHSLETMTVSTLSHFLILEQLLSQFNQQAMPLTLQKLNVDHINHISMQMTVGAIHAI